MKLPKIAKRTDVEKISDGGSMMVRTLNEKGSKFHLYLKIVLQDTDHEWKRVSYLDPILVNLTDDSTFELGWESCANIVELPPNLENRIRLE